MLKGINVNERINFISKQDTADNPTIFILGNLTNSQKLEITIDAQKPDGSIDTKALQKKIFDILEACVKEIKNLDGKDFKKVDKSVLDMLEFPVLVEVMEKALSISFPTDDEIKN